MNRFDRTYPSPEENLACDEALWESAERGDSGEVLRTWEPLSVSVVLGWSNRIEREANVSLCRERGIPILRRRSGGGAVVLTPGCVCYALVLDLTRDPAMRSVAGANAYVMEKQRRALERAGIARVRTEGLVDLAIGGRKVSGNASRRGRRFLLFHGTFLLNADLTLIAELLPLPTRQPDYRRVRPHAEFLTNLGLSASVVKRALADEWGAFEAESPPSEANIQRLVRERYAREEWTRRL